MVGKGTDGPLLTVVADADNGNGAPLDQRNQLLQNTTLYEPIVIISFRR